MKVSLFFLIFGLFTKYGHFLSKKHQIPLLSMEQFSKYVWCAFWNFKMCIGCQALMQVKYLQGKNTKYFTILCFNRYQSNSMYSFIKVKHNFWEIFPMWCLRDFRPVMFKIKFSEKPAARIKTSLQAFSIQYSIGRYFF